MSASFESQWNAAWFRTRAEQCFRLAATLTRPDDAAQLRALGQELEAQAMLAEEGQSKGQATGEQAS